MHQKHDSKLFYRLVWTTLLTSNPPAMHKKNVYPKKINNYRYIQQKNLQKKKHEWMSIIQYAINKSVKFLYKKKLLF